MVDPGVSGIHLLVGVVAVVVESTVMLGVAEVKMGPLHKSRNLLELFVGIFLVVLHDTAENFSQVTVQVSGYCAIIVVSLMQLMLDFLQRFRTEAHFDLFI